MFYIVNDNGKSWNDVTCIPYSEDIDDAIGYVKFRKLGKDKVARLTDEEFKKLEKSAARSDNNIFLSPIMNVSKGVYITEEELDGIDELGNDAVYAFELYLDRVFKDLRYFRGKEVKEFKKAIKKFRKSIKKKDDGDFSINLFNQLNPLEILKDYRYDDKKGDK